MHTSVLCYLHCWICDSSCQLKYVAEAEPIALRIIIRCLLPTYKNFCKNVYDYKNREVGPEMHFTLFPIVLIMFLMLNVEHDRNVKPEAWLGWMLDWMYSGFRSTSQLDTRQEFTL